MKGKSMKAVLSLVLSLALMLSSVAGIITVSAETTVAEDLQAAFTAYVARKGNDFNPVDLTSIGGYTAEVTDYFITHAVDGVYDTGDSDYPLSIPGHDGSAAAILTVDGTAYGVTATIPHIEENLGTLTKDVYSADNANFTTNASGQITGYSGSAEKIVIPSSFTGERVILWNNGTTAPNAKNNTKVVMFGDGTENSTMSKLKICEHSFEGWSQLRAVVLPDQMLGDTCFIDQYSFKDCPLLKYVRLPSFIQQTSWNGNIGKGYGMIYKEAFANCPLENAADKNGYLTSCRYYDGVFAGTTLREIHFPANYFPGTVNPSDPGTKTSINQGRDYATLFYNAFLKVNLAGAITFVGSSNEDMLDNDTKFFSSLSSTTGQAYPQYTRPDEYSLARTLTLAAAKAAELKKTLVPENATAENVKSQIDAAVSGKGYDFTSDWNGSFDAQMTGLHSTVAGTLTLTCDDISAMVDFSVNLGEVAEADYADSVRAAAKEYFATAGNNFDPWDLEDAVNAVLEADDHDAYIDVDNGDWFIQHAVDGIYDSGDTVDPLSIPGHDGYVAAILTVDDTTRIGVTATIPHADENLGVLTKDVYSADSTVFTTDESGNITDYTGTAEKIVIPATYSGNINLSGSTTGKANVKAVLIGNDQTDMYNLVIGDSCFAQWSKLEAVVLPKNMKKSGTGVSQIGWRAFWNNPNLKCVRLPSAVQGTVSGAYGIINDGAFMSNPKLRLAEGSDGVLPSAAYGGNVFSYDIIRDFTVPTYYTVYGGKTSALAASALTKGTMTLINQSANTSLMDSATQSLDFVLKTKHDEYTTARAAIYAQMKADTYNVNSSNAANVASEIATAFASKSGSTCDTLWVDDYSMLKISTEDVIFGVETKSAPPTLPDYADQLCAAARSYAVTAGNGIEPDAWTAAVNAAIGGHTATLAEGDFFITHAVDGVYDEGDTTDPLSIPGHDGYAAAIFTMEDGSRVGVTTIIPHTEENLGTLTKDVYSVDSAVFTTDENGNITDYSGTAEKIVIPTTFTGSINLAGATGKANVKVVIIGDKDTDMNGINIGAQSFENWPNLRAVSLPYAMKAGSSIGWRAFNNNAKLKYIRMPISVNTATNGYGSIGDGAFMNCPVLENVASVEGTIPSASYGSSVMIGSAVRDARYPEWMQNASKNIFNTVSYTKGVLTFVYSARNAGLISTSYDKVLYLQSGQSSIAGAAADAQRVASGLTVTDANAANAAGTITAAFSAGYGKSAQGVWNTDNNELTFYCGAFITVYAKNEMDALTLDIEMLPGASIRKKEPVGMRFSAVVNDYGALEQQENVASVKYGMLIAPEDYLTGIDFTAEALDAAEKTYLDIPQTYWVNITDTSRQMNMVISNIRPENYARPFAARAYAEVTFANGKSKRVYSTFGSDNVRSVNYVAGKATFDTATPYTAEERALFQSMMVGGASAEAAVLQNAIMTADTATYTNFAGEAYSGTTYYVSPTGSDSNNGTSPSTPWKTVSKVASKNLASGSKVLFERGGTYRGTLTAKSGVYYGAYGTGAKPKLYGSWKNYVDSTWTQLGASNPAVYWVQVRNAFGVEKKLQSKDAGIIVCDDGKLVGEKKYSLDALTNYGDFYYNYESARLYINTGANPKDLFSDIEIGVNDHMFIVNVSGVTVENLSLKYTGAFGISCRDGATNFKAANCEIAYCGGSDMAGDPGIRYGNGIEFWGETENALVDHCWIYQIYDSGISPQGRISSDGDTFKFKNVTFSNNLIEYCTMAGIEYWVSDGRGNGDTYNHYENMAFTDNIIRFAGLGWGSQNGTRGPGYGIYTPLYTNLVQNGTFTITGNTVDCCRCGLVSVLTKQYGSVPTFANNTLIQYAGEEIGGYGYYTTTPPSSPAISGTEAQLEAKFGTNADVIIIR